MPGDLLGLEALDLLLALHDEAKRRALHAARRQPAPDLLPQQRREIEADQVIERAPRLLPAGRITGLIGPNGSGKTTLLTTILGLARRHRGSVRWLGAEISSWPVHRRARAGIGWVPQERSMWRSLTVDEHLDGTGSIGYGPHTVGRYSASGAALQQPQLRRSPGRARRWALTPVALRAPSVFPGRSSTSFFSTTFIHLCLPALYSNLLGGKCLTYIGTEGNAAFLDSPCYLRDVLKLFDELVNVQTGNKSQSIEREVCRMLCLLGLQNNQS